MSTPAAPLTRCGRFAAARAWQLRAAALACGLGLAPAGTAAATALAGVVAALGAASRCAPLALTLCALVLAGFALGDARVAAIDRRGATLADGAALRATAELLTRPRPSRFGSSAELRLHSGPAAGARLLASAPARLRWPRAADPGVLVAVRGSFARPRRATGRFDLRAHLRRRGLAGELRLDGVRSTGRRRGGLPGAVDALRRRSERALERLLPPDQAALLRGMVLGQDERIEPAVRDDFRAAGLGHLLAVSGQNVMLLSALALPALVAAGFGRRARSAALLALIAVYVPLAGAGPSLQRAGVMGAAALVAAAASRPASRTYALGLAAVVTLALNPRAAGDVGWQLSFAAVAGIVWLGPPLRVGLAGALDALAPAPREPAGKAGALAGARRLLRAGLVEGVAVGVAATVATAPLVAHHFGAAPLVSLPANLLALPVVAPAMWAGMVLAALGQAVALGPPLAALAAGLARPVAIAAVPAVDLLGQLAERFAALRGPQLRLPFGGTAALVGAYAALALGVMLFARYARRAGPRASELAAALRSLPVRTRAALAALALAAAALGATAWLSPPEPPSRPTVSFLDVGQGDATLIQQPDGTAVLFDGGPPEGRVERLLRAAGVRRLSALVMTHASRDHHGGLGRVVERHAPALLLDGGDGTPDRDFRAVVSAARRRGARVIPALAPLRLRIGSLRLALLSPRPRPTGPAPDDPNPRAVVAVVSIGDFDLLLSADAESDALAGLALPRVEAIKVAHHGSADPGLPALLRRLRPRLAAIEVGANSYGHPAPSTLAALRSAGVRTWRTDRDGTVALQLGEEGVSVATER